jgi:hypothetical protein
MSIFLANSLFVFSNGCSPSDTTQKKTQTTITDFKNESSLSYQGIIEAGYGVEAGKFGMSNFKLNFINGLNIDQYFYFGLGVGIDIILKFMKVILL